MVKLLKIDQKSKKLKQKKLNNTANAKRIQAYWESKKAKIKKGMKNEWTECLNTATNISVSNMVRNDNAI